MKQTALITVVLFLGITALIAGLSLSDLAIKQTKNNTISEIQLQLQTVLNTSLKNCEPVNIEWMDLIPVWCLETVESN